MEVLDGKESTLTLKSLSGTHWSARADAIQALIHGYSSILDALGEIEDNLNQTPETRDEARALANQTDSFETVLMAKIWNHILIRFNSTNKALQGAEVNIKQAVDLIDSLQKILMSLRNMYDTLEEETMEM